MKLFDPADYKTASMVKDLLGIKLPDKPNWLRAGAIARVTSAQTLVDQGDLSLLGCMVPENGDMVRIAKISEHPHLPGWFGVALQTLDSDVVGDKDGYFCLYDPSSLPDIRPNFEPVGDA